MDNETVTISADYFAELYTIANAKAKDSKPVFDNPPQSLWLKIDELTKERDELKERLAVHDTECGECNQSKRLAEAERCIEEVSKWIGEPNWLVDSRASNVIRNIIRAWRENREAK